MASQELKELELKIDSRTKDISSIDCINFLQNHLDETEYLSLFLFSLEPNNQNNYITNRFSRLKYIREIIESHPTFLENFLKPIFNIPNDSFKNQLYLLKRYKGAILDSFLKSKEYNYSDLATILSKIICKPFNFFTKCFLNDNSKLREQLEPLNPEVYKLIDEELAYIRSIIEPFRKSCYVPIVNHLDSTNPRVSKFGGALPYLPLNGPPICRCKADKLQTVFSLYVPSLPCEMKNLFPEGHEYVVVGYTCNSCYIVQRVVCYVDDEIDQLVYDDVPSIEKVFNEPRTVVDWKEFSMLPTGLIDSGFELPNKDQFSEEQLFFIEEMLLKLNHIENNRLKTYLAGYPFFIQGDDSPKNHVLLLEMEESEASTNLWGDCGTAQVWMTTGKDFGSFIMQYACS